MSASLSYAHGRPATDGASLRFGQASDAGAVQWLLKRNCSLSPRQTLVFYASLCVFSLGIAAFCWVQGATFVVPFAGVELLAVGAALVVYARHAADREVIRLHDGRLSVAQVSGDRVENVEFASAWVRVEPRDDDRSLIELSGQGRQVLIGRFLRPELRRPLADELRTALQRARAMPVPPAGSANKPHEI